VLDSRPLGDCLDTELNALLSEECRHWARELDWDFTDVASAVAGGLARGALTGRVVRVGSRPVAYCYCLLDEGRVVVGSLFGTESERGRGIEEELLQQVLADAQAQAGPGRVECQTLFSTARDADPLFVRAGFAGCARLYMTRGLGQAPLGPAGPWRLRAVTRSDFSALGQLIHRSHVGSLDGILNLTYSSPAACRHFVETLVLRSGCGPLDARASRVAEVDGRIVGAVLASRLSRTNGHICQVSVAPEWQARGLGTALMSWALEALDQQGLRRVSLSVTLANRPALRLYERLGFRTLRSFGAHAWVRPPARIRLPA
jgi:ribosomal protein S18 acetylase RimI-like enzyme